jgi:AraC-like DNA-binding protein
MLYQPPGVAVTERIAPKVRDTGVSLYCRPKFLAELAQQNGIERWPILEEIQKQSATTVWMRQAELSPTLLYVGKSLLDSPYTRGIRLLHAEAKALELLCDVLAQGQEPESDSLIFTDLESRQLLHARRLLSTQLSEPLRVADIARAIGMSESKLKRTFKARFDITVFDFGLSCRMRHALQLLRCGRLSVGEVAYAAGYRHPTSFSAAFLDFFGFLPRKARTEMH